MKILHLPLMAKWYEMIERGEKLEEYREVKSYWIRKLTEIKYDILLFSYRNGFLPIPFKKFDAVKFRYGYTKRTMTFRIKNIRFGKGKKEWGAGVNDVFIIELGERIQEGEV